MSIKPPELTSRGTNVSVSVIQYILCLYLWSLFWSGTWVCFLRLLLAAADAAASAAAAMTSRASFPLVSLTLRLRALSSSVAPPEPAPSVLLHWSTIPSGSCLTSTRPPGGGIEVRSGWRLPVLALRFVAPWNYIGRQRWIFKTSTAHICIYIQMVVVWVWNHNWKAHLSL